MTWVPVLFWNCVPMRCCAVPLPLEPNECLPGAAFSRATSSSTFFAGVLAFTTSTLGTMATVDTGTRSFEKS